MEISEKRYRIKFIRCDQKRPVIHSKRQRTSRNLRGSFRSDIEWGYYWVRCAYRGRKSERCYCTNIGNSVWRDTPIPIRFNQLSMRRPSFRKRTPPFPGYKGRFDALAYMYGGLRMFKLAAPSLPYRDPWYRRKISGREPN